MDIQPPLGGVRAADFISGLTKCTPYPCEYGVCTKPHGNDPSLVEALHSIADETSEKYGYNQTLFPIVQDQLYKDLRVQSAGIYRLLRTRRKCDRRSFL